jgi:hypothetical protein
VPGIVDGTDLEDQDLSVHDLQKRQRICTSRHGEVGPVTACLPSLDSDEGTTKPLQASPKAGFGELDDLVWLPPHALCFRSSV